MQVPRDEVRKFLEKKDLGMKKPPAIPEEWIAVGDGPLQQLWDSVAAEGSFDAGQAMWPPTEAGTGTRNVGSDPATVAGYRLAANADLKSLVSSTTWALAQAALSATPLPFEDVDSIPNGDVDSWSPPETEEAEALTRALIEDIMIGSVVVWDKAVVEGEKFAPLAGHLAE